MVSGRATYDTINENEAVKLTIVDDCVIYSLVSQFAIVFCTNQCASNELKQAINTENTQHLTEWNKWNNNYQWFHVNQRYSVVNTNVSWYEFDVVTRDEICPNGNKWSVEKKNAKQNEMQLQTKQQTPIAPTFAEGMKSYAVTRTPKRLWQFDEEKPEKRTRDVIEPKETLSVILNTEITDESLFKCHKLVKKDALTFVFFKISYNGEHFDSSMLIHGRKAIIFVNLSRNQRWMISFCR